MKKTFFAIILAVIVTFTTAIGLCVQALNSTQVAAFSSGMRIVVDAGHGGMDGGVVGRKTKIKESDLNLSIAMVLKEELTDMGFEVVLTRKTEAGLYDTTAKGFKKRDMQKRKEIIEEAKPSLILSVHQNFYPLRKTRGAQVFYSAKNEGSKRLAAQVQEKLNKLYMGEGVKERKITAGEYFMLECYPCPSVIIECGFLSNERDEALLSTAAWRKQLAQAIAGGALGYFTDMAA